MTDQSPEEDSTVTDAESAFMTLSHDLRLEILLALWDAPDFSLSFSDLRKAVGERDSGSFTYHLSKLEGHFVAETDDGYELQYPGHRVLDAIQSGVFHDQATVGPVDLETDCRTCGAGLTFEYDTDYIGRVRCPDCGNRVLEWPFDPGGTVDRSSAAIVHAFDRRTRLIWSCALDGVCPFCAGRISRDIANNVTDHGLCVGVIEQLDRYDEFFARDHDAVIAVDCERCSFYSFIPIGVLFLTKPTIAEQLRDSGVAIRETRLWNLGFVVDPDAVSIETTDPTRVAVTTLDTDEALAFVVDETLDVIPAEK